VLNLLVQGIRAALSGISLVMLVVWQSLCNRKVHLFAMMDGMGRVALPFIGMPDTDARNLAHAGRFPSPTKPLGQTTTFVTRVT